MKIENLTLLVFLLSLLTPVNCYARDQFKSRPKSVSISAHIGQSQVTIYGYTSPNSRVELKSSRIFDLIFSNKLGYFEFNKTLLPINPSELCLSSTDSHNRHTPPVCIPPPPNTNYHTQIGPIIIAPTLTLDSDKISPNSTIPASGQTIPNTPIEIFFFQKSNKAPVFPKEIHAFTLPKLSSFTDPSGNFSFNLPTAHSTSYRLYVSAFITQLGPSPKSNTLAFHLPSLYFLFWQEYSLLIIMLPLFLLTLAIFCYLIYYDKKQTKPTKFLPALYPKSLMLLPNSSS